MILRAMSHSLGFGRGRGSGFGLPEFAAITLLVALYSYSINYLFGQGWTFLQPNYAYATVYVLGALTYATSVAARRGVIGHSVLLCVLAVLFVLMALQFLILAIPAEGIGLFFGRLHFLLTMVAAIAILSGCAHFQTVVGTLGLVVLVSCGVNLFEFLFAGSLINWMSTVPGRAAGFYENANDSAMFIAMAIPLVALNLRSGSRYAFYLLTFAGTYVTFSRGGLVTWALLVALSEMSVGGRRNWAVRASVGGLITFCVVGALSLFSADLSRATTEVLWPYLDANTSARIEFLSRESTDERMAVLQRGWDAFTSAPIFGQGIGFTHAWELKASVHNMIVLMLAEMGLIGAFWYSLFLLSIGLYRAPFGPIAFATILTTGLFSHNHLERPAVAIVVALYVVASRRSAATDARQFLKRTQIGR